jgi:hypothetical protein
MSPSTIDKCFADSKVSLWAVAEGSNFPKLTLSSYSMHISAASSELRDSSLSSQSLWNKNLTNSDEKQKL